MNNVKMKNKDEISKSKLINNENNSKINSLNKSNIIQVIKTKELNLSNFDPMKYKKALLNKQNPKKIIKAKDIKKGPYFKRNTFQFFGPYNKLINGGGGFCKRLYNKNYNLNIIYELLPNNIPKYKLNTEKNDYEQMNLSSYRNNKKKEKIIKTDNILIQENDNNDNYNNIDNNIRYNLRNNKKNSTDNKYKRLNIEDVNNSIKYLKLDNNLTYNAQLSKRETFTKNNNDKKIYYKKVQTEKKNKKMIYEGININKIANYINNINKPKIIKKLELNSTPTQTIPYEEVCKTERILIKDNIEQFSMDNKKIKKFNNLIEADSVLLNYSPVKKDKSLELKNKLENFSISSNNIELNYIKIIPKIENEKKKKLVIKTNELEILSTNVKPKLNKKISCNIIESNIKQENEIINKEKEEIKKEINNNVDNTNNIQTKIEEIKINNNDNDNNNEKEIIENRRSSKTVVDKLAKYKERLKRKNEANKQKIENKQNKIKNLAFELESKMYKKEMDEQDNKEKKEKNPVKIEINYNIPIINKKKMKKKLFSDI